MTSDGSGSSSSRNHMHCHGHPPVCNVADLVEHGETVLKVIRERGEENEGLVKLYESGRAGQHIPQGSIKSFRQYADYMTLSSLPIWPITPVKVSLFLLFRLLMGDVTNGTPLRNAYLRSLARSLEHYREETARYFISRWPEAGGWIIRDGRGDPESRNDITHDILRICKLGQHRRIETLLDFDSVQKLVTGDNSALTPDAWATRRRLSARWVRDRDSANLPERQYAGGKFIGEPPKPPPLSARSTHWNRHLHDLRDRSDETSWIATTSTLNAESFVHAPTRPELLELKYNDDFHPCLGLEKGAASTRTKTPSPSPSSSVNHPRPLPLNLAHLNSPSSLTPELYTPSLYSGRSLTMNEPLSPSYSTSLAPITPVTLDNGHMDVTASLSSSSKCVLPSLAQAGLHPSYFPLPPKIQTQPLGF